MNTTLSPVTVQRFYALQGDLIGLVEQDYAGLTPKLEQIIRAFEFTQIELEVYRDRGYAQGRGVGQPEEDRCALACAFLAKAVLDLKTTRALIDRLQADSKLRRLCGFDLRHVLPSESTFSRSFDEFATSELMQRVHARMITDTLGEQLIGHISRDSTAIEARESIAKKDKAEVTAAQAQTAKPKNKRGRPRKDEVRPAPEPSPLERQRGQTLEQMLFELDTACATGTKKNAQGYKISWKGYKLHLDTACCGIPISAVLTGANVHDSRVALPLSRISAQRVDACYELMDAAYCSTVIREEIQAAGRVPLIDHNPRKGEKREFAPHEAQRYKTRSGAERCNARLKDEFGARHVQVRGHAKVMCHLMLGVVALCADQFTRLLQ
jgi:transposase